MKIIEIISEPVIHVHQSLGVSEAARLMRDRHVGSLVVVEETGAGLMPVGMLTDRDIAVAVVAEDRNAMSLRVGDVMTRELITVREDDSVADALRLIRQRGVRRLPVTTEKGMLIGIVTLDDLLEVIADEIGDLVQAIRSGSSREGRERPSPALS